MTHDLNKLFLEYRRLYPELRFLFKIPLRFNVGPNFELFPDDQEQFHLTLDQRHRYPSDRRGNTFATKEEFDPIAILKELDELDHELKVLEWAHIRPHLCGKPEIK